MSPTRLLYIITLPDLGGAQSHVLDLIKGFRARYDVQLATSACGPLTDAATALGIRVHLLPSLARTINPLADARVVQECMHVIRHVQPSLVHVHSSKAGLVGRIAARIMRVPVVFTAHGWGFVPGIPRARRGVVWISEMLAMPLATRIICVSQYDQRLAERAFLHRGGRFVTVHNGIEPQRATATPGQQPVDILMTARFSNQKDQQLLVRAFAAAACPDAQLTFVGDGPTLPACQALAATLGVSERVRFLGNRSDVEALLAQAHVFALTTHYEGLPISILEAMRAGLPVVASNVGGISEQVEHGITGFLTPPGDIDAVAAALNSLVAAPQLRQQMGLAGRGKFLSHFTVERMLDQTDSIYREVLATGAPASRIAA